MSSQPSRPPRTARSRSSEADRYRWVALTNTTMAVFMSNLDGMIILIALPAICNGIHLDPLAPALLIALNGVGIGMYSSPDSSSIMSSVPAEYRGVASGMRATFQNSGTSLSIGVFFSLMIAGLASALPRTLTSDLAQHGVIP